MQLDHEIGDCSAHGKKAMCTTERSLAHFQLRSVHHLQDRQLAMLTKQRDRPQRNLGTGLTLLRSFLTLMVFSHATLPTPGAAPGDAVETAG